MENINDLLAQYSHNRNNIGEHEKYSVTIWKFKIATHQKKSTSLFVVRNSDKSFRPETINQIH